MSRVILTIALSLVPCELAVRAGGGEAAFVRGDIEPSGAIDLSDAIGIFGFLFLGGRELPCLDAADADDSGSIELTDGIFLLNFLFSGGREPSAPSPSSGCVGIDPTADTLGCESGAAIPDAHPGVTLRAHRAPAAGVSVRSRRELPSNERGEQVALEGQDFVLLVEARSDETTRAAFDLERAGGGAGDARFLDVRVDRALGDPAAGGVSAGENLASRFFADLEGWEDRIYLLEHASLRIEGTGPLAPAPGLYRITARVIDRDCAVSVPVELLLRVEASDAPRISMWLDDGVAWTRSEGAWRAGEPSVPIPSHAGSGQPRLSRDERPMLVVELAPNGRAPSPVDASSLSLESTPAPEFGGDLSSRLEPVVDRPGQFALRLEGDLALVPGVTRFVARARAEGSDEESRSELEVSLVIPYASGILPIWNRHCTGCHEAPDAFRGLEVVHPDPTRSRRNLVHVFATEPDFDSVAPRLVRPFLPDRSYLWHKLRGTQLRADVLGDGEPMPLGGMLSDEELHLIESWILDGAAE